MEVIFRRFLTFVAVYGIGITFIYAQSPDNRMTEREIKVEDQFVKAKLLEISGKTDDAIKLLDSIRRSNADNGTIYFELAKLHYTKHDWNLTESNINQAIKTEPGNLSFKEFEMEYFLSQSRVDEAKNVLNQLIAMKPERADYYWQLTDIEEREGQYPEALNTIALMEKNLGWRIEIFLKKADILAKYGKLDDAVSTLNDLAIKFPDNTTYLKRIVKMLQAQNRSADTEPYFKRILDINPNDAEAKIGLILLSNKSLKPDDRLSTLYPLVKNENVPIDIKIKELIPFLQKQAVTGDTTFNNQLISISDLLVNIHPNEAKAHAFYGDVLKNTGNITAAIRQYERTLELNKNIYPVWEQLMFCLNTVEDYDKLNLTANNAIDYFPNQALSYCFAAKAAQEKGNSKKTNSLLDDALLISAGNPEIESIVWVIKAEGELKQKRLDIALEYTQMALKISNDENADAWEVKGDIARAKSQPKEATTYWKKALDKGGNQARISSKLKSIKNP